MKKGILIDPFAKTVTEVEVAPGIDAIYKLIGQDIFDVVTLTASGDAAYVDDEGLYRDNQKAFALPGLYGGTLAGKALILGTDAEGGSRSPVTLTVETITELVEWDQPMATPGFTFHPMPAGWP